MVYPGVFIHNVEGSEDPMDMILFFEGREQIVNMLAALKKIFKQEKYGTEE
jgi:hypothetical protein